MIQRCDRHALSRAGWRCDACGATLCPQCSSMKRAGSTLVETCLRCGGYARQIRIPRREAEPFDFITLLKALRWPFTRTGLITIFASAVFVSVFGFFGSNTRVIAAGVMIAYLFQIVRHTAIGGDDFPAPDDFRGYFDDVVMPNLRLAVALAWLWVPALYFQLHPSETHWVRNLLIALGVLLAPMSLLASALRTPLLTVAANPIALIGYAIKLGRDYLLVVVFGAGATLLEAGIGWIAKHTLTPLPFGSLPANFALLLVPFGFFRAIGLFVRACGSELGYGGEEEYLVPALGEMQPGGPLIAPEPEPPHVESYALPRERHAPIELDVDPLPEENPLATLARLVSAGDKSGALNLIEAVPPPAHALSAQSWMELGKSAIDQKRAKPAVIALKRCVDVAPQGPLAPQAWLLAARVYDEGMSDKATSDRLLTELSRRFPESAEGKFAAARLRR